MPKDIYIRHLPGQGGKLIDENQLPKDHVVFNPSIAYPIVYMRGIKKTQFGEENYIILYNVESNKSYTIMGLENILQKNVNTYKGLEDLRIINFKNKLWFSGTSTHASSSMNSEVVIGYFNNTYSKIEAIEHISIGKPPIKNICLFIYKSKLYLFDIYKKGIYEVLDKDTKQSVTENSKSFAIELIKSITTGNGIDIENLKGSTNPIQLHGNLYGCIVHTAIYNEDNNNGKLAYLHYWLEIDMETGNVTYVSKPFWVTTFGIEFITGIRINDDDVELYIGLQDKSAIKYITKLSFLRSGR